MGRFLAVLTFFILVGVPAYLFVFVGCEYNKTETLITSLLCGARSFDSWELEIEITSGEKIEVKRKHSSDFYLSFGHAGGIGNGGNDFQVLEFKHEKQKYKWTAERDEIPIVLRLENKVFYLATFDRSGIEGGMNFSFYSSTSDGRFSKMKSSTFPVRLAVQNTWLNDKDKKLLEEFDYTNFWFRHSLTVKMWDKILRPTTFDYAKDIDEEFVKETIEKYFKKIKN